MNPKSFIRTDIPERTVLFRHPAASFKVDSRIRYDTEYIKAPDLSDVSTALTYYKTELKRIENSKKSYVIMNYNPIIADCFSSLISDPDSYNYKNWVMLAFFHEDKDTFLVKHKKSVDIIDLKADILLSIQEHKFIKPFILPVNHVLTFQEVMRILLETWGYKPNPAEP